MARHKDKGIDILFWANLNPNKRGSFEDYICHLASACNLNGLKIKFILGDKINDPVKNLFDNFKVDFCSFSSKELISIWPMAKVLECIKPKIIHFNFIGFGSPLILLSKIMGVDKIILTDHTSTSLPAGANQNRDLLRSLKTIRRQFFMNRIDRFIAVSNFVGARLQNRDGMPFGKINVIHNGVDLDRFRPPEDELEKARWKEKLFDVGQSVSVVTYIGQLIEEKGLLVYLEALRGLLTRHEDMLFVFVGAGPLEEHLVRYIKELKNNRVRFLGFRDDAEVILKASDLVIVPSVWEEAFGLVIAEALACGVPVIGSRIGGIPEVLLEEKTGILTTPGGTDELVKAIERLVRDRDLKNYFSGMAREHVENHFDVKMQVSKTLELYQQCLG